MYKIADIPLQRIDMTQYNSSNTIVWIERSAQDWLYREQLQNDVEYLETNYLMQLAFYLHVNISEWSQK